VFLLTECNVVRKRRHQSRCREELLKGEYTRKSKQKEQTRTIRFIVIMVVVCLVIVADIATL